MYPYHQYRHLKLDGNNLPLAPLAPLTALETLYLPSQSLTAENLLALTSLQNLYSLRVRALVDVCALREVSSKFFPHLFITDREVGDAPPYP